MSGLVECAFVVIPIATSRQVQFSCLVNSLSKADAKSAGVCSVVVGERLQALSNMGFAEYNAASRKKFPVTGRKTPSRL